jgi:hypothetical protein
MAAQEQASAAPQSTASASADRRASRKPPSRRRKSRTTPSGSKARWSSGRPRRCNLSVETTARIFEIHQLRHHRARHRHSAGSLSAQVSSQSRRSCASDIESARKVTEDANARLSAVEAKLASSAKRLQKFRAEVEAESLQDERASRRRWKKKARALWPRPSRRLAWQRRRPGADCALCRRSGHRPGREAIGSDAGDRSRPDRRVCGRWQRQWPREGWAELDGRLCCPLRQRFSRCGYAAKLDTAAIDGS